MASKWNLAGQYLEACNCEVACPCVFTSPPTTGECTVLVAWHIDRGKYGDTSLNGLNAALAAYSPGHMLKVKWDVALYIDEKATPTQRDSLTTIFGGKAGGPPAALGPFIGRVLRVKPAQIEFHATGKQRSLRVANVGEMEISALEGSDGNDVVLEHMPLSVVPSQPTIVAKSKKLTFHDHGWNWNISEKNGFYSPFNIKGP